MTGIVSSIGTLTEQDSLLHITASAGNEGRALGRGDTSRLNAIAGG